VERSRDVTWSPQDIPDQSGRVAVVTGANGGIGLATTIELARAGAHVVMAARDQEKAAQARRTVEEEVPEAELTLVELDLGSLRSVRECARAVTDSHPRLDLLVNNAGVMGIPAQRTVEGFEKQFGVNHLGHFVLTKWLMPALLAAPAARIVTVTSFARVVGSRVDRDDARLDGFYEPWLAYGRSKLANLHFAYELQRRLEETSAAVASIAAHPGFSHTDLQARSVRETGGGLMQRFWDVAAGAIGMSPRYGAHAILRAATDPQARGGELHGPLGVIAGPAVRRPIVETPWRRRAAEQLWEVSEEVTGEVFDVSAIVSDPAA
jgi:NAD(P)-dependent dehydrogenase (short-subunit alcohol dehydrogenase family)